LSKSMGSTTPSVSEELLYKQASTSLAASSQILAKDPNAAISPFPCMSSASSVVLMNLLQSLNLAPRMIKVGRRGIFDASATTSRMSPFRRIQIRRCLSLADKIPCRGQKSHQILPHRS